MLQLQNIVKDYRTGDTVVRALDGISLTFRKSEFVAVLGASGCGKTTLLNIVGGLDRYTDGDLLIRGKSTKEFRAYDWDAYRNSCVGFVFQSYNLIPHQTVLGNVELALTLSGIGRAERRRRAEEALAKVGLSDQLNKKPNQLSGGQMQRVAIARAIVNDPEIILADEPTGALDSRTSVQISDLLAEISEDRLVIMVTHNNELAEKYASRIVRLSDGVIVGDTNPYTPEEEAADEGYGLPDGGTVPDARQTKLGLDGDGIPAVEIVPAETDGEKKRRAAAEEKARRAQLKRTSMKYTTALSLSFRNLVTKKGRTFMTAFAGSIGIIGIALVLAISNGFNRYIDKMQRDTLSNYPVTVSNIAVDLETAMSGLQAAGEVKYEEYPDDDIVYNYDDTDALSNLYHVNYLTEEYVAYVDQLKSMTYGRGDPVVLDIQKSYAAPMNMLTLNAAGKAVAVTTTQQSMMGETSLFQELLSNKDFIDTQYDLLGGTYPQEYDEIALVVDKYNRLSLSAVKALGFNEGADSYDFDTLIGKEYKLILNDAYYTRTDDGGFAVLDESAYADVYADTDNTITLTLTGILRIKEEAPLPLYSSGLVYLPSLTEVYLEDCAQSEIGLAQKAESEYVYRALIPESYIENFPYAEVIAAMKLLPSFSGMSDEQLRAVIEEILDADRMPIAVATVVYSANYGMMLDSDQAKELALQAAGASGLPGAIYIYPQNFESKAVITRHLDAWNVNADGTPKDEAAQIRYTDAASMLSSTMGQLVDIISYVLIAFAAVSLVVSSIMIAIITYVSVIERTKEIGVLRSIGARKKDITRVFNAETILIGFTAGVIGVAIAFVLTFPVSAIIKSLANGMVTTSMAVLSPLHAVLLVAISVVLTLVSGLIPAFIAAKRDPVVALRSE